MKSIVIFSTLVLGCLGAHTNNAGITVDLARNAKIVNGEDARDGEFPFQVSLQRNGGHFCGATLLSTEWVLTAAHCIYGADVRSYSIRAGTNDYSSGGSVHNVVSGSYHEQYHSEAYWYNDIAVLKVSPPVTLSNKVHLVKLPPNGAEPADNAPSVAIGWGSRCYGCGGISHLQKVNLKIYSHQSCLDLLGGQGPTSDMVCSGAPEDGKGVCDGDSGGALLVDGTQVGITSWTVIPCALAPAVWTKISHYRDWIHTKTGV